MTTMYAKILYNKPKRVLDMGSGYNPYYRATDAMDAGWKNDMLPERQFTSNALLESGVRPDEIRKLKLKLDKIDQNTKFGEDYNKRVPYPDNIFDEVTSHASLGAFGKQFAYNNAYRILKHGGTIYIRQTEISNKYPPDNIIQKLRISGFVNIRISKNYPDTKLLHYGFFNNPHKHQYREDIISAQKPYR